MILNSNIFTFIHNRIWSMNTVAINCLSIWIQVTMNFNPGHNRSHTLEGWAWGMSSSWWLVTCKITWWTTAVVCYKLWSKELMGVTFVYDCIELQLWTNVSLTLSSFQSVKSLFLKGSAFGDHTFGNFLFFFPRRLRYVSKDWLALSQYFRYSTLRLA